MFSLVSSSGKQQGAGVPNNVVVGTKQKNVANHCRPPRPPDQPSNGTIITAGFVDLSDGWLACYQLINTLKPRLAKAGEEKEPHEGVFENRDYRHLGIPDVSVDAKKCQESATSRAKHQWQGTQIGTGGWSWSDEGPKLDETSLPRDPDRWVPW